MSSHSISVSLSLDTETSEGSQKTRSLGSVQLAGGETSQVDLDSQFGKANPLPDGFGHISATFQGQDGDLLMQAGSVDQSKSYVFEVPVSQQSDSASRTICFWSTEGDNDTMMTVWNYKTTAQNLVLTLYYSGGQYVIPIHLQARQAYNLDMMSLVRSRVPDANGTLIPSNIHSGSAMLSSPKSEIDKISVAIAASVFNVRNATCGVICNTCDGVAAISFDPGSYMVNVAQFVGTTVELTMNTGEIIDNPSGGTYTTGSGGSSIFNTDSSGNLTGDSPGQDELLFELPDMQVGVGTICAEELIPCPIETAFANASITVPDQTPIITGISPSVWDSSTTNAITTSVTFTGQYFGTNAPNLSFSPSNGISYQVTNNSDTQILANITVQARTPTEDVGVTVTNNGYGSNAFNGQTDGNAPASQQANARIQAASSWPEITIVGWVNSAAPDITAAVNAGPSTAALKVALTGGFVDCSLQLYAWEKGNPLFLNTSQDVTYANAWLLQNSGNPSPPSTISPVAFNSAGQYRLFNDFGNGTGSTAVGKTPFPCVGGVVNWFNAQPATSQWSGATGTTSLGNTYQLAEGQLGPDGQKINFTINRTSTPWIWSVVEFDSSGNPSWENRSMFPTFSVYKSGALQNTYPQSPAANFINQGSSYYMSPAQIQ